MEPVFTIGILGGCGEGESTARYFARVADFFLAIMPRIRIIIPLTCKGERSVALHLLAHRQNNPGLEILVVLTSQQWQDYQRDAPGETAAVCNGIINAADLYIVRESFARFNIPDLYRFFIEHCEHIVFNEHRAGVDNARILANLIGEMAVPVSCQCGLCSIDYFIPEYPFDRRLYRVYDSGFFNLYAEIKQSINFLRQNKFVIYADRIPQVFIRKWLTEPPQGWHRFLATPDDTTAIFRLRETPRHDYITLKVFAAAYSARNDMWATNKEMPTGDVAIRRFQQFRHLLNIIATKRDLCEKIEPFDLFSFGEYDKVLRTLVASATANHREPLDETLPEMPKVHEPRKRIQRKRYIPARQ